MATVNIFQVASDGSLTNVVGTTISIAVGETIELIGGSTEYQAESWNNYGDTYTISWSSDAAFQCNVTGVKDSGGTSYALYMTDTHGNSGYVMIEVTGGSSSTTVSTIFCRYDGTFYEDGNTISVNVGDTLNFEAWAMLSSSGTRDTAGVFWGYADGNKGYVVQQSYSNLEATYYAQAAGTQKLLLTSKTDMTKSSTITVTVSEGTTKTIDYILGVYNDKSYTSSFTITVAEGDTFTLTGYAVCTDGTIDTEKGIAHVQESGQSCIRLDTEDRTSGVGEYTALAEGQTTIWLMPNRDYSKELEITVIVTSSGSVLSGIRVSVDDVDYTQDFGIDLIMSETSKIFSAVSIDQNGDVFNYNNCAFKLMSGGDYIKFSALSGGGAVVVQPKAVGKALIKAYCTDNEDLNILIVITVVEDTSQTGGYAAYIFTGSTWEEYIPYIYNGSTWEEYEPYICPFPEETEEPTSTPTYSVTNVADSTGNNYGFALNSDGYYESQNQGQSSSYAVCQVSVTTPGGYSVYVDCISYGESNFDYGILSEIGNSLALSSSADSSGVKTSFKGNQSASVQTVDYGALNAGTYSFYAKYIKDSSVDSNNDSLQFKVRFVEQ